MHRASPRYSSRPSPEGRQRWAQKSPCYFYLLSFHRFSWSSESFYQISMVTAVGGQISSLVLAHPKRHPSGLAQHRVWQP